MVRKNVIRVHICCFVNDFADRAILFRMSCLDAIWKFLRNAVGVFLDMLTFFRLTLRTPPAVAAENLFLRKQLALYVEPETKPHRATNAVRFTLTQLSRFLEWRYALTVVKPDTLICWHRKGIRLFWKWKSRPAGRPRVPVEVRNLIGEMAENNPTWGAERIADELLLKIGIQTSPRTVRRYMPTEPKQSGMTSQPWTTFGDLRRTRAIISQRSTPDQTASHSG